MVSFLCHDLATSGNCCMQSIADMEWFYYTDSASVLAVVFKFL